MKSTYTRILRNNNECATAAFDCAMLNRNTLFCPVHGGSLFLGEIPCSFSLKENQKNKLQTFVLHFHVLRQRLFRRGYPV